jgi:hypothetical protein
MCGDSGSYLETGRNGMKIGIVGAGHVGVTAAYSMMMRRVGSGILLVDRNADLVAAQARDILDATPFADPVRVRLGEFHDLDGARLVVLATGTNQRPGRVGSTCCRATPKSSQGRPRWPGRGANISLWASQPVGCNPAAMRFREHSRSQKPGTNSNAHAQAKRGGAHRGHRQ